MIRSPIAQPARSPTCPKPTHPSLRIMAANIRTMDSHIPLGQRIVAPAAERNKDPILEMLKPRLPSPDAVAGGAPAIVLEVACGTGQHAAFFAQAFPHLVWQPTDRDDELFGSVATWGEDLPNVRPPAVLDAAAPAATWPVGPGSCAAALCVNMTHISPWEATRGLLAGAGEVLAPGARLFIYGPFKVDGRPTTDSNAAFDARLRGQDPRWGLRDVAEVDAAAAAAAAGLVREEKLDMPANNFVLVYRKQ